MKRFAQLALFYSYILPAFAQTPHPTHASTPYLELRIYTITSGKMDAVLERFRDTVDPVRRNHGIDTVGYWSAPGSTNGGTFAYLMRAPSKEELLEREKEFGADPQFKEGYAASERKYGKTVDRIETFSLTAGATDKSNFSPAAKTRAFDIRIYSIEPGKLEAFRNRWHNFAAPIYERHGLQSLGCWVAEQKDTTGHDQFICLLAGDSTPAILKSISEFHKDAEWIRVEKGSKAGGKLRAGVTSYRLTPTEFSALK